MNIIKIELVLSVLERSCHVKLTGYVDGSEKHVASIFRVEVFVVAMRSIFPAFYSLSFFRDSQ
jgi:hypothetical protein